MTFIKTDVTESLPAGFFKSFKVRLNSMNIIAWLNAELKN